ncbi:hypothetical protein H0H81_011388 [Sphagnurus paluster]|uniref:HAT C-terminal dimerisation domain-containing protein n=1 Tax=Sphagnurus paluster TaxID=117069 RepID=A0A9P7G1J4_9AGAR|nr:hypothetical protein H0H81_011388 [Sphagnurus paluster]
MASSVSSERAFSSAGITISKRRNRLGADIIEALQFLKCWFQRDLIFREDTSVKSEQHSMGEEQGKEQGEMGVSWAEKMLEDVNEGDEVVDFDGDDDDDVFLFQIA